MRVLAVLLVALVGLAGALERVQMNEVYRTLPFDDPDGGVWKQGWEIKYDEQWTAEEPLNIFVVRMEAFLPLVSPSPALVSFHFAFRPAFIYLFS